MTILNDLCDFCARLLDPIGCDTQQRLDAENTLWCGQCEAGLIYRFRNFSNSDLARSLAQAEQFITSDGLSWEHRGKDLTAWGRHVQWSDATQYIQREQTRRATFMEPFGDYLGGATFWDDR